MNNAFSGDILTLIFGVAYGIATVISSRRNVPVAGLSGNENTMGFGQLVPLFLMALPVLAAGEIYFGK